MVVEDDDNLRLAVTTELTGTGLRVDQAADIGTAHAALSTGHVRLCGVRPHAARR